MVPFVFYGSSIAISVPSPLLFGACLTFLLYLPASPRGVLYVCSEKICQTPNKNTVVEFFLKVVGLQRTNLLRWNPMRSVLLGITEIIF